MFCLQCFVSSTDKGIATYCFLQLVKSDSIVAQAIAIRQLSGGGEGGCLRGSQREGLLGSPALLPCVKQSELTSSCSWPKVYPWEWAEWRIPKEEHGSSLPQWVYLLLQAMLFSLQELNSEMQPPPSAIRSRTDVDMLSEGLLTLWNWRRHFFQVARKVGPI